jgi:hypothetical protein
MSEPQRMAAITVKFEQLAEALGFPAGARILRVVDAGDTLQHGYIAVVVEGDSLPPLGHARIMAQIPLDDFRADPGT